VRSMLPGTPRRLAVISAHTSPLAQPGSGDAGGLNVYVAETSRLLARRGVAVDIFTRATHPDQPAVTELAPGVRLRHVEAGQRRAVAKEDMPGLLSAFSACVLREHEQVRDGYDLIHSHYWLSGEVGAMLADRWGVPLVHTPHTLARVKDALRPPGQGGESEARVLAEEHLTTVADAQVVNSAADREALVDLYGADPSRVPVVPPGVDLRTFRPGAKREARDRCGLPQGALVVLYVGRIQPLKGPDVVVDAARELVRTHPRLTERLLVLLAGGPSGTAAVRLAGLDDPSRDGMLRVLGPVPHDELTYLYRSADVLVMPSRSESFGLVALEAQACGTPVVATRVGGLVTAVADGISGVLVESTDAASVAGALRQVLGDEAYRSRLAAGAALHARAFPWDRTVESLLSVYRELPAARVGGRAGRKG